MNSLAIAGSLAAILAVGWNPTTCREPVAADPLRKEAVAEPRLTEAGLILGQVGTASGKVKTISIRTLAPTPITDEFSSVNGSSLNPAECSLGTENACSTTQGGSNRDCSVKETSQDPHGSTATCSVLTGDPPTSNGFCSVDANSNNFCSVIAGGITPNSDCSVKSEGDGNFCSIHPAADPTSGNDETICSVTGASATARQGAECSVFGATGQENFCSVYKGQGADFQCTVFQGGEPVSESNCSTHDGGGATLCSVVDPDATPPVTGPVNGVCKGG